MTRIHILLVALLLVSCGGSEFTADPLQEDAGPGASGTGDAGPMGSGASPGSGGSTGATGGVGGASTGGTGGQVAQEDAGPTDSGSGGTSTGGVTASGGTQGSGGNPNIGGVTGSGGTQPNTGGTPSAGGTPSTGGSGSGGTGGATSTGGTTSTGGSGGTPATGGTTSTGGTVGSGGTGTGGSGGNPPVCTPSTNECFGGVRQTCDSQGQWVANGCPGSTPACLGAGVCVDCSPNPVATKCDLNGAPQFCDSNGKWQTTATCFGLCDTGICQPLILAQDFGDSIDLAVDSQNIYLPPSGSSFGPPAFRFMVLSLPLDGFTITPLQGGGSVGWHIIVDSTHIYYQGPEGVWELSITGGNPTLLVSGPVANFKIDATNIYWVINTDSTTGLPVGSPLTTTYSTLLKMPLAGGTVNSLATTAVGSRMMDLAVDSTSVYWGTNTAGISKVSINGGTPTVLVPTTLNLRDIDVDGQNLYWADDKFGIKKVSLSGGLVTTLYAGNGTDRNFYVTTDGINVYWDKQSTKGDQIMRVSVNGGAPTVLATMSPTTDLPQGIGDIEVDASAVYWTTRNSYVMKTNK